MTKFFRWLFWRVVYVFLRRPSDLEQTLLKGKRCWWPWKKFRPGIWHNDDGNFWQIWFDDERAYTEHRTLTIECHVGMETGNIVGLNVWNETLRAQRTYCPKHSTDPDDEALPLRCPECDIAKMCTWVPAIEETEKDANG